MSTTNTMVFEKSFSLTEHLLESPRSEAEWIPLREAFKRDGCILVSWPTARNDKLLPLVSFEIACNVLGCSDQDLLAIDSSSLTITGERDTGSPITSAMATVVPHTDGALLGDPYRWVMLLKKREEFLEHGESSLIHRDTFLEICQTLRKSPKFLRTLALPYRRPRYSAIATAADPVLWWPIVYGPENDPFVRYAPDILVREYVSSEDRLFLEQLDAALISTQQKNAFALPPFSAYCIDNRRWLHGRLPLRVLNGEKSIREVLRVRGW